MSVTEIILKYKNGEATLEETNDALKEIDSGLSYDPDKNVIHPGEEATYGLLDTGTGTLDKVEIRDGELVNCDCGDMYALCKFNGKLYRVYGNKLGEEV